MKQFLILIILHLLCINASAQDAQTRTCRILFLGRPASAPTKLQLFDGATAREVDLPGLNFSPVYHLPEGNLVLTLLPSPPQDPEKIPHDAPSTKVEESILDFYLIVTSDPENKVAPVRINAISADSDQLRLGQMLWLNLTDLAITGNLGNEKLTIRPRSKIIINAPVKGIEDYPVSLSYQKTNHENWYPICETRWVHDPRGRHLGFVYLLGSSRTPRVQIFPDYRIQPETE